MDVYVLHERIAGYSLEHFNVLGVYATEDSARSEKHFLEKRNTGADFTVEKFTLEE